MCIYDKKKKKRLEMRFERPACLQYNIGEFLRTFSRKRKFTLRGGSVRVIVVPSYLQTGAHASRAYRRNRFEISRCGILFFFYFLFSLNSNSKTKPGQFNGKFRTNDDGTDDRRNEWRTKKLHHRARYRHFSSQKTILQERRR